MADADADAAVTRSIDKLVKEAVNVGAGLFRFYKAYKDQLLHDWDDVQQSECRPKVTKLREDMEAVEKETQRALDNQVSLIALFSKGACEFCARLDTLQSELDKGFDSVVKSVEDDAAVGAAREIKMKLSLTAAACNLILDGIVTAAENKQEIFPAYVMRDMEKAEYAATELFVWANSFVPDQLEATTKEDKLKIMPYIVAMAYAARIQIAVQILERDMVEQESDKIVYLKRARKVVDSFVEVLESVLDGMMANTSLLEIALDYRLPVAMFLALMTSFRSCLEGLLSPSAEQKDVIVWDDGLSSIRDMILCNSNTTGNQDKQFTVKLSNATESVWWAAFTNTSLDAIDATELRTSIGISELCHVLGAGKGERIASFALKTGRKSALTQLPPASTLRDTLCTKITEAREAAQGTRPPPPPDSFARTSAPLPADMLCTAGRPRTLSEHFDSVFSLAVCADGDRVVSGSGDCTARVWSLSSRHKPRTCQNHSSVVNCVAVSPDGRVAVSGSDHYLRVWDTDSGSAKYTLQGHSSSVYGVALSPNGGTVASGSNDMFIKLWSVSSNWNDYGYGGQSTRSCTATLTGHSGTVRSVAFTPDGNRLVSGSDDTSIKIWNVPSRTLERTLRGHSSAVYAVAVTPDGRSVVSGSADTTVRVWSLSRGTAEMVLRGHTRAVKCVAVFPDGKRIVSGGDDNRIRVWNLHTRLCVLTLKEHTASVESVAVRPDGYGIVSGSADKTIKVWPLNDVAGAAA